MKNLTIASKVKLVSLLLLASQSAFAAGNSGGLSLLTRDAKSVSLGEAYTAAQNEIGGFSYNPASLGTLKTGQASFLYERGMAEDAMGQFMIGTPSRNGGMGLSVGYYNAGTLQVFDGVAEKEVTAQRDLTMSLGYSHRMGNFTLGGAGKYINSELVEKYKASAYAMDLGMQLAMSDRLNVGAAMQNLGTEMKFINEGDKLPLKYALGASYLMIPGAYATTLMVDVPYYVNEKQTEPAVGVDVSMGLLSLRAGYRKRDGTNDLSVGAGFMLGKASLDYAFGMANDLNARHLVSLSMRFGGMPESPAFVKQPTHEVVERAAVSTPAQSYYAMEAAPAATAVPATSRHTLSGERVAHSGTSTPRRVYIVKPGDTLASIAKKYYGTSRNWKIIYTANKHLIDDPTDISAGQKIVLP